MFILQCNHLYLESGASTQKKRSFHPMQKLRKLFKLHSKRTVDDQEPSPETNVRASSVSDIEQASGGTSGAQPSGFVKQDQDVFS